MIIEMFLILASYLIGAIPFGLLIGRMAGIDVRLTGSGNIGATNVSRALGKKLGILTLFFDVAKGFLPVWGAAQLFAQTSTIRELMMASCGLASVIGHMFPVYLKFKGGKGVATALGVFFALSPWSVLMSLVLFVIAVACSGYVSVGSLVATALLPLWLWMRSESSLIQVFAVIIVLFIWFKHRTNIGRLRRGEEKSWRKEKV